jgi:hypothetical protein
MKKSYKVKIIIGAGEPQTLDISSSAGVGSTTLNAVPGGRYQLIDAATGLAPDNIRVTRRGKDLKINFDGLDQAELVIADFYAFSAGDANTLVGEPVTGNYHAYIPESGDGARSIAQLTDSLAPTGMALGREPIAATDFLPSALPVVAAAGINPLWAAPLLLLGAGGGGGSKTTADTTPPPTPTAAPASYADNVGPITSTASTARFTDDTTPGVFVGKNLTDTPGLYVDGRKVAAAYDAASGTLTPTTPLADGPHALTYTLTDAAGNESGQSPTRNVTVDTAAPAAPTGALYGPDDTGQSATDGLTGNNIPRITGLTEPNATVKITINGQDYVGQADEQGRYLIPVTNALPNTVQTYKVQTTDAAGNSTTADGTPFTVDASNVSTSQGVSIRIDAIEQDTGVNQSDFITGDNTPVWRGALVENNTAKFNTEDWLQLQWVNAQSQIVATEYIKPTLTAGVWNWSWPGQAQALADGVYTLKTQLVDTAGNVLSTKPWVTTQTATVDTQAQKLNGLPDPNADFKVTIQSLMQDTGRSAIDFLTNTTQLSFTGKVSSIPGHSNFDTNTGRVLTEVIDSSGKVKAFQYLSPSAAGDWTFDNTALSLGLANAITTYTLKIATVDMAGHTMNAASQSFTVDLKMPVVSVTSSFDSNSNSSTHYTQLSFSAGEPGVYIFNNNVQTGTVLNLGGVNQFAAGNFKLVFRDTAGNEQLVTNDKTWDLSSAGTITLATGSAGPGGFGDGQLVGSVGPVSGKYEMTRGENLDLSTLYTLTPTQGANGGLNHIVMGAGAQTLTVSIGDVLELGISNSFSNDAAFKDHLQMRVDGDTADQLNLTKQWANSTDQGWALNPAPLTLGVDGTYNVYTNDTLKLDLFVKSAVLVTLI